MTFSEHLGRHINVAADMMNNFDEAELGTAIAALPGYPDCSHADVRSALESGDINARLVAEFARGAGELAELARDWVGRP